MKRIQSNVLIAMGCSALSFLGFITPTLAQTTTTGTPNGTGQCTNGGVYNTVTGTCSNPISTTTPHSNTSSTYNQTSPVTNNSSGAVNSRTTESYPSEHPMNSATDNNGMSHGTSNNIVK